MKDSHAHQSSQVEVCQFCSRPALPNPNAPGYCILHAQTDEKDLLQFGEEVKKLIAEAKWDEKPCDFTRAYFPYRFNYQLLGEAFRQKCIFREALFSGDADFRAALSFSRGFQEDVNFERATFKGHIEFETRNERIAFHKNAIFLEANFEQGASFQGVIFNQNADFRGSQFGSNLIASFVNSQFEGGGRWCMKANQE